MKAKILILIMVIMAMSGITYAMEKPSIGGIPLYSKISYVKQIYGEPTYIDNTGAAYGTIIYYYGKDKSVMILVNTQKNGGNNDIANVYVTANNGFQTPEGIHVGSTLRDVLNVYGDEIGVRYWPDERIKGDQPWEKVAARIKNQEDVLKDMGNKEKYDFLLALQAGQVPGFAFNYIYVSGQTKEGYIFYFNSNHTVKEITLYDFGK